MQNMTVIMDAMRFKGRTMITTSEGFAYGLERRAA